MVTGSERLGPLSDYAANCRPVLSSERAPHRNKTANFIPTGSNIWSQVQQGCSIPRHTNWPHVTSPHYALEVYGEEAVKIRVFLTSAQVGIELSASNRGHLSPRVTVLYPLDRRLSGPVWAPIKREKSHSYFDQKSIYPSIPVVLNPFCSRTSRCNFLLTLYPNVVGV
jgi:hypothetical protein